MIANGTADVAVVIVSFRNPGDVRGCLAALSDAVTQPNFDVFICENGGVHSFKLLIQELVDLQGPCHPIDELATLAAPNTSRFNDVRRLRFRTRLSNVWVGCATENLGYAGGINAWLQQLQSIAGWKGVWILNPDAEPEASALAALVERAATGRKGMVGSTILDVESKDQVRCRGGLHWQRFAARTVAIGLGDQLSAPHDLPAIESAMDSPSGASMFVTRPCLEKIGPMDENYFLFFEDLDWGLRAKACGLGYASASLVRHKRGTTTGSAKSLAAMPRLTVYLQHRNGVYFVRKYFPRTLPIRIGISILYAFEFLISGAPKNCWATLQGILAGLRGEVGRPVNYDDLTGYPELHGNED